MGVRKISKLVNHFTIAFIVLPFCGVITFPIHLSSSKSLEPRNLLPFTLQQVHRKAKKQKPPCDALLPTTYTAIWKAEKKQDLLLISVIYSSGYWEMQKRTKRVILFTGLRQSANQ